MGMYMDLHTIAAGFTLQDIADAHDADMAI